MDGSLLCCAGLSSRAFVAGPSSSGASRTTPVPVTSKSQPPHMFLWLCLKIAKFDQECLGMDLAEDCLDLLKFFKEKKKMRMRIFLIEPENGLARGDGWDLRVELGTKSPVKGRRCS